MRTQLMVCAAALAACLWGCGGGGDKGTAATTNVNVSIHWPDRSRTLDALSSALSVKLTLKGAAPDGSDFDFVVERDNTAAGYTKTYTSSQQARTGTWSFAAAFHSDHQAKGAAVGSASAIVNLLPDGSGIGDFAVTGKVASVVVSADQFVAVEQYKELAVQVKDDSGASLAVRAGAIFWQVTSGTDVLQFEASGSNAGAMHGVAPGVAIVAATVDGVRSAPQSVSVRYDTVVEVGPAAVTVYPNGSVLFEAKATSAPVNAFNWKIQEGSSGGKLVDIYQVGQTATYVAPATPGTYHIVATSRTDPISSATATVTVTNRPPPHGGIFILEGWRVVQVNDMSGTGWAALGDPSLHAQRGFTSQSMALDAQGRIYLADYVGHRIIRFDDITGRNWTTLNGHGVDKFDVPISVHIASDGRIYVADQTLNRIIRLDDMSGAGWTTFNKPDAPTERVWSVSTRSNGHIVFTDESGNWYEMNDMSGTGLKRESSFYHDDYRLTVGPDNRLWGVTGEGMLYSVAGLGDPFRTGFGGAGSGVFQFNHPSAVSFGPDGHVYVADTDNGRIVRFDDNGGTNWTTLGSQTGPRHYRLNQPFDVKAR